MRRLPALFALMLAVVAQDRPEPVPPSAPAAEDAPPPIYFVATLEPGPAFVKDTNAFDQEGIADHVLHLQKHFEAGEVVMAGPFLDNSGAMVIYQARGLKQAKELAAADPSVQAGLFKLASVKPWMVALR